ncbi:10419_t:CDS:2 [Entrophospora sp. SA101]|nr:10419_t:CDS:2 [Entrophospora sp. SA101]
MKQYKSHRSVLETQQVHESCLWGHKFRFDRDFSVLAFSTWLLFQLYNKLMSGVVDTGDLSSCRIF